MLFISFGRQKPTRAERRAKYATEGIPTEIARRVYGLRDAQSRRVQRSFQRQKEFAALTKADREATARVNAIFGRKTIFVANPESLGAETRRLLGDPKNKKIIVKCFAAKVRFFEGALDFVRKQKGIYKSHIEMLKQTVESAKKKLAIVKYLLGKY